jgi:hypothetical protein
MAVDTTQLTDYTAAQLRLMLKHAWASLAMGGAELRTPDGRLIRRATKDDLVALGEYIEALDEVDAADDLGGMVLVRYGERI